MQIFITQEVCVSSNTLRYIFLLQRTDLASAAARDLNHIEYGKVVYLCTLDIY